jgi:hypothetical protein
MTPSKKELDLLKQMNATYRFCHKRYMIDKPTPEKPDHQIEDAEKSGTYCEVFDQTLKEMICSIRVPTESSDSLAIAVAKAITSPKPLTPAQKADPGFARMQAENAAMKAELDALRAERDDPEPAGDENGDVLEDDAVPEPPKIGGLRKLQPTKR